MVDDNKKVEISFANLPPVTQDNKYNIRYRVSTDDGNKRSDWSVTKTIDAPNVNIVNSSIEISGTDIFIASWGDENDRPEYDVFVSYQINPTISYPIITNSVGTKRTLYFPNQKHNFVAGQIVEITGLGSSLNGTSNVIYDVTDTSFSWTASSSNTTTNVNVSGGASAGVVISVPAITSEVYDKNIRVYPTFKYHGTTPIHTYTFRAERTIDDIFGNSNVVVRSNAVAVLVQVAGYKKEVTSNLICAGTAVKAI